MHNRFLTSNIYPAINKDNTAFRFIIKLLILLIFFKTLFYFYNQGVISSEGQLTFHNILPILKWSFVDDLLVVLIINTPYMILLALLSFFNRNRSLIKVLNFIFVILNFVCLFLNAVDVVYFHFHRQRADADLLFVLQHPLQKTFLQNPWTSLGVILTTIGLFYVLVLIHKQLLRKYHEGKRFLIVSAVMFSSLILLLSTGNKLIPTYPLTQLNSHELQLVQNSFHTFSYSVYRMHEAVVRPFNFSGLRANSRLNIKHPPCPADSNRNGKNIVLFIMESIPEDFFDAHGKYKVAMPFLDSLIQQSTYFKNAFSYGHSSNKGITSILSGIPTLTEIPLYHSNYAAMPVTRIGSTLAKEGYSSSFFIGDNYDDFGFAQCCNWLGIQHYYSKENIPGYKEMESHTMGLHDKYVLDFMSEKINNMPPPFLAINYNTSTHYPNDLPKNYHEKFPVENFSAQMKSMNYYNECLESFFKRSATRAWFKNTVFIFCSDHWMYPDTKSLTADMVQSFHIPVFIYDPETNKSNVVSTPVSQFDIINTILCLAADHDSIISYGTNLLDLKAANRMIFTKENANLYQAIDSNYVLGFNVVTRKPEYCYNYNADKSHSVNLVLTHSPVVDSMTLLMKAFLETAARHYNNIRD